MRIVLAFDGELLVSPVPGSGITGQREAVACVVEAMDGLLLAGHELVIVHGNAPQVGYVLLRGEAARHIVHTLPLDICGADTQGATGYMLQQALHNWFERQGIHRQVATVLTQVVVEDNKPVSEPAHKGIGPFFDYDRAQGYEMTRGWEFELVTGHGYQRVVPCLTPSRVVEAGLIKRLSQLGVLVICAGGGGIPVRADVTGNLVGVEAVVDKSQTATLLAQELEAEALIFVSAMEKIARGLIANRPNRLLKVDITMVDNYLQRRPALEDGWRNKLIASANFLLSGGKDAFIVAPEQLKELNTYFQKGKR